jgi:hypothetical protein
MRSLWRFWRQADPPLVGGAAFAVLTVALLAAYTVAAATGRLRYGELAAAAALLLIVAAGLLYIWRLGAAGLDD